MRRVVPLLVIGLLAIALFAAVPGAQAAHAYGHRFMLHGQILDADGEPAQNMPVTLSAKARQEPYPQMTIQTDCNGYYYSQATQQGPQDTGLDGGRLHLHAPPIGSPQVDWGSDPEFFISTPFADYREDALQPQMPLSEDQLRQYAIHIGDANPRGAQAVHVNVQLDVALEPAPECEDGGPLMIAHESCQGREVGPWQGNFLVAGKVQVIDGRQRIDQVTDQRETHHVTVSLETTEGVVTEVVQTDLAAMYCAVFENVTVEPGARITAEWDGNERRGEAPQTFRAAGVDIIVREWFFQETGFQVFMGILGGIVILGAAVWAGTRIKDKAATKKAMERSTRKRANR